MHRRLPLPVLLLVGACAGTQTSSTTSADANWPQGRSLRVASDLALPEGEYLRPPLGPDGCKGVIVLEGARGVTLDLGGVQLRGRGVDEEREGDVGGGIVLRGCRDVTLRGGELGGYRGCVVVLDSSGVTVEDVRFDGWFGQRLRSTIAAESGEDWLWPHHNDQEEWITNYGAAISFTDCRDVVVRRCRGRHGQNGILLTRTSGAEVYDNDFSFLSGWGIGLYRSSRNTISHNVFDYCVRGYSHDVYSRGQDSAGILLFERCCDNVVAYNSATHGGDGVFLFAGNDLVGGRAAERGEEGDPGGGDRNLFYGNDLRFSPANALEATFSNRNLVIENDLSGCYQHGVWGGYSSEMLILRNRIDDTVGAGVTIEHGQENVIAENRFHGNNMAVEFYWDFGDNDRDFIEGPFGAVRETSSRRPWLLMNTFSDNAQDVVLRKTTEAVFFENDWGDSGRRPYIDGLRAAGEEEIDDETVRGWMADRKGTLPTGHIAESTLSPWEGRYPPVYDEFASLSPPDVPGTQVVRAEERGVPTGDRSTIVMGRYGPWDYRSGEPRPEPVLPGGLLREVEWDALWFRWDQGSDPRADLEVYRARAEKPLVTKRVANFLHPWGDEEVKAAVGSDRFGLQARGTVVIAESGTYRLGVLSDDGVRVTLDGEVVFEDWTHHAPRRGEVELELSAGEHELLLEYFQIDGATALSLDLE